MNRNRKKVVAASLATGMAIVMGTIPVLAADSSVSKQETVYVNASSSGTPQEITVSDWLKDSASAGNLSDVSELKGIKNVKGDETFEQDGEDLTWNTEDKDIYYQGTTDKELPASVQLTYYLDGVQVKPDELAGKSGHLKIEVKYTNNAVNKVKVGKKNTNMYSPFVMATAMILPVDNFTNVTIDNGKILSDGQRNIAIGVGMPGLADSLDLKSIDKDIDVDIPEGFTMEADVTDFSLSSTFTFGMTDLLDSLDTDNIDGLDDLKDSIKDLTDAATKLVDGAQELSDGADTLNTKYKELDDGIGTLQSGVSTLNSGAATLKSGVASYTSGADTLASGVKQYTSGVGTLTSSLTEYNQGVNTLAAGAKAYVSGTNTLGSGIKAYVQGATQLGNGISQYVDGIRTLVEGVGASAEGVETAAEGISAFAQKAGSLVGGLTDTVEQINDYADSVSAYAQGTSQFAGSVKTYAEGTAATQNVAQQLADLLGNMADSKDTSKADQIASGLKTAMAAAESIEASGDTSVAGQVSAAASAVSAAAG